MLKAQIAVNPADMAKLVALIPVMRDKLGMSLPRSLAKIGTYVASATAAATRVAPKKRRVVRNPNPKAKTDGRMAKWGVMKYKPDGSQYFVPIYRTGEFGKLRFTDKTHAEYIDHWRTDPATGKKVRVSINMLGVESVQGFGTTAGIMHSPKRNIKRSGVAKKSWQWMARHTLKGGRGQIHDIPAAAEVRWSIKRSVVALTLRSNLRYMADALKNGRQTVSTIGQRAEAKLRRAMQIKIDKLAAGGNA